MNANACLEPNTKKNTTSVRGITYLDQMCKRKVDYYWDVSPLFANLDANIRSSLFLDISTMKQAVNLKPREYMSESSFH